MSDLVMSPDQLTALGQEMSAKSAEGTLTLGDSPTNLDGEPLGQELESDFELPPSDFWDETSGPEEEDSTEAELGEQAEEGDSDGLEALSVDEQSAIKYKANGEEFEATLEEAQQALALAKASRQALTSQGKLKKENKVLKEEREELVKYQRSWEKLEDLKSNPDRLMEILFDKPAEEVKRAIAEEYLAYQDATPEMKTILDHKRELEEMRREYSRQKAEAEKIRTESSTREFQAEKKEFSNQITSEFTKYNFDGIPSDVANGLKEMLWDSSINTLKKFNSRYGKINDKMVKVALKQNYDKLMAGRSQAAKAQDGKEKRVLQETAKKKAQEAATQNYNKTKNSPVKEMQKLDPMTLFTSYFKKK